MDQHNRLPIDEDYLLDLLLKLLGIPSPTGFTDHAVHFVGEELERLSVPFELTRRGAIRANLQGVRSAPDRAIVTHLDTLGAIVKQLKPNGRLALAPIGTWSARWAEGARVTVFTDHAKHRGTILPLKASGHVYNAEIDDQPISWENLEVRIDERLTDEHSLFQTGFRVGDFVAVDPLPEVTDSGFIVSRHLDNKAGVACVLAAIKAVQAAEQPLPVDCHPLFTISEEVGSGASGVLHQDVAEMLAVDNSTHAPDQNSDPYGVTVAMADSTGPFEYHLTRKVLDLAREHEIPHSRDVFRHYRCDAASAIEAGNDIRTALICFALDASHGYERTHLDSLVHLARLIGVYMQSEPTFVRDRAELGPLRGFPEQTQEEGF
jgi:peptidase M42 family hydrolase